MRGSALVAVVGLFAGRPWALEKYFSWLSRVEWQRLHIVAGDNSCNPEFGEMLRNKLNDLGRPFAYVPLWLQGIEQMSNAEFGESETRRAMGMVGLSNHVARCYNQLAPFIPAGVDFIWIVEDDVEPPDKALEMLMKTFSGRPKLAATCARTIDRTNRAAVEVLAWKDHKALSASSLPRNTVLVDRVSFTCTLIRRDAWDLAPPRQAAGCADWSFSDTAKARGMELLLHGGVQCRHWRSDGSVV